MRNVFIVNNSGHDYSEAANFGTLISMTYGTFNKMDCTGMVRAFLPFIEKSNEDDLIVQSGPSIMMGIVCAMFSAKHKKLNLLLYNGDIYLERNLVFDEILQVQTKEK